MGCKAPVSEACCNPQSGLPQESGFDKSYNPVLTHTQLITHAERYGLLWFSKEPIYYNILIPHDEPHHTIQPWSLVISTWRFSDSNDETLWRMGFVTPCHFQRFNTTTSRWFTKTWMVLGSEETAPNIWVISLHRGPISRISPGASLKFSLLNRQGRVWTLIAGGGASVVPWQKLGLYMFVLRWFGSFSYWINYHLRGCFLFFLWLQQIQEYVMISYVGDIRRLYIVTLCQSLWLLWFRRK